MATLITVSRFLLALPACALLLDRTPPSLVWAFMVILLMELTDLTDGLVARRDGGVSDVGKLLDPLVDSLARFTIFAAFLAMGVMPLWMLLIIFYRDMVVSYMRSMAATQGVVMMARSSGKAKALVQGAGIELVVLLLLVQGLAAAGDRTGPFDFFAPVVVCTIVALAFLAGLRVWSRELWLVLGGSVVAIGALVAVWVARPAVPFLDDLIYWTLGAVALTTAGSLIDYGRGLAQIVTRRKR